jgi:PhnB protein
MQVEPYLFFEGRCDEAIAFYGKAVGAKVSMLMRYKESPEPGATPHGAGDKVMHARLQVGDSTVYVSDGRCSGRPAFGGFALSLTVKDVTEAASLFASLADGGQVQMPLLKTFFSPSFGMLTDRFGLLWIIYVAP